MLRHIRVGLLVVAISREPAPRSSLCYAKEAVFSYDRLVTKPGELSKLVTALAFTLLRDASAMPVAYADQARRCHEAVNSVQPIASVVLGLG
jgi:hypothetical protein